MCTSVIKNIKFSKARTYFYFFKKIVILYVLSVVSYMYEEFQYVHFLRTEISVSITDVHRVPRTMLAR